MSDFTEKHGILVTVERVLQNMQNFLNFSKKHQITWNGQLALKD